jgi:hypothetical protein
VRPHGICHRAQKVLAAKQGVAIMIKFLLWCLLFVLCWPLALLALIAYPFVWLLLLPFRIVGIAVHGALDLVAALIFLPARVLQAV